MTTSMDANGLGVTPEMLSGAAAAIDAAVREGDIGSAPTPAAGPDYGHAGAADAVARFGSAVGAATKMLVASAEGAATGLRGGANAYLAQEAAALRAVRREQAGLAGLMGVTAERHGG